MNVIKYGLGTENCKCWMDVYNGEIRAVYLQYYDCLHFFTNTPSEYPLADFIQFKREHPTKVIMTTSEFGERLVAFFEKGYYIERNNVIDMDGIKPSGNEFKSTLANEEDIEQIVDLLLSDKEYTEVYSRKILLEQMLERYKTGFSRYFVVKMDGKIVASCSTYGEVPGFALIGSVIVHKDYRRRGLAFDVENYACALLEEEYISRVGFVNYNNDASLALHEKLGAKRISTLYKFVSKER